MMRKKKGFSLIEIMLVMAIIGLLVSLILPAISKARWNSQMTKCAANLGNLYKALEGFVQKASGRYESYRSFPQIGINEGDQLPTCSLLWRLMQQEDIDSLSDIVRANPSEVRKQVLINYVCNINRQNVQVREGSVSYRGPTQPISAASLSTGELIAGDDLLDHGRDRNRQINVMDGSGGVTPRVHDDPVFSQAYNQQTCK